jgi:tRNA-intron endonuclease
MVRVERVDGGYIVFDEESAKRLYWGKYFGRPVNTSKPKEGDKLAPLRLSRYEALYLLEKNEIEVYSGPKKTKPTAFRGRSATTYLVYKDLREKGLIVRSGLKFGATFAVYLKGPGLDHAPFLVQVVPDDCKLTGVEVIRAGRLSHGIKKNFVFASVDKQGRLAYATLSWVKA